jgi:dienelactone hydrolase
VAVLRYDKRTLVHRDQMIALRDMTVEQEVIADALAAVALARATPGIDPSGVFVLGHSFGGYLAPRILARDDRIAGAIVLSGEARPMQDLILEQIDYIAGVDGTVSADEKAQIGQIKAELARLSDPALSAASPPIMGVPATYWIDLRAYDPVAVAKTITRPLLILQGGRDYQVTRTDFELWQRGLAAHPNVIFRMFPDLNHLYAPGTGPSTPAEYARPSHVAPAAIDEIARFISAPSGRR